MPSTSPDAYAPVPRRQNLAADVYESLKAMIMDGLLEPGARVNVDETARRLGVSQSPLREALTRLEGEGLVIKEPFRGYSITHLLTRDELEDLYQFRMVIECWAAGEAARRIEPVDLERLHSELATCPQAPKGPDYANYRAALLHDIRLHDLIQQLAGNEHLRLALRRSNAHLRIHRFYYRGTSTQAAIDEHQELVRAIGSGDPDAATSAMRSHLHSAVERLRHVMTTGGRAHDG